MENNLSILMLPWLAHGHIFPFLELAKKLSEKNFHIYFCSTAINLTSVSNALGKTSIQLVELHLPSFPDLLPKFHSTKFLPPNLFKKLYQAFHMSESNFSKIITSLKPDMLIHDFSPPWAAKIASSLGIPSVHFSAAGATAYSFLYHIYCKINSDFPYEAIYHFKHERKALEDISILDVVEKDNQEIAFRHFDQSCEIILMKTSREIEGKYIDYLSFLSNKKIVSVGPLVIEADENKEDNHSDLMLWLNRKSKFSTVFISFGSENYLSKNQIEEIAKGLEGTNVNFIWAVRFPGEEISNIEDAMPNGFLETVKGRGIVLEGWAPQAKILAHSSIGAFVSHCGMSSIMESIHFGVPIIAIPLKIDQPINARLVVEAGVGVEVIKDDTGDLSAEEVKIAINKVIVEKCGDEMRAKAKALRKKMKSAEGNEMSEAVEQIFRICKEHKQISNL